MLLSLTVLQTVCKKLQPRSSILKGKEVSVLIQRKLIPWPLASFIVDDPLTHDKMLEITTNGKSLEQVNHFRYLEYDGSLERELSTKIRQASGVLNSSNNIWRDRGGDFSRPRPSYPLVWLSDLGVETKAIRPTRSFSELMPLSDPMIALV